ncbi:L-lysine-aminomutase [Xylaria bambusicola]|uniref:L-lysine-aminomutase n=1 Tax=Xylaria bambusicola TaxID=326684 RepID=UPI0020076D3E|nr:L-lysine-aminomutase [Xylaria bambusicola]KAI0526119.1 L-lysine-aminomutase [Xylaria bambusicola]
MFSSTARSRRLIPRQVMPWITASFPITTTRHISNIPSSSTYVAPIANTTSMEMPPVISKSHLEEGEFWRELALYRDVSLRDFYSWSWNINNILEQKNKLSETLYSLLPDEVPRSVSIGGMQTADEFVTDVWGGIKKSAMSVRVVPYVLSRINWADPANCPVFRQFIPLKSIMIKDHPKVEPDSLHELQDMPVEDVVHRYPDKALFLRKMTSTLVNGNMAEKSLALSVCPTYCIFCTRSYGVGAHTYITKKTFKLGKKKLENAFAYMRSQPQLKDIVISGGDAYYLPSHILEWIGDELISMDNIERFRIATKGLAVAPNRILDDEDDWTAALIRISNKARKAGKHFALHTHFNHPNEISWITEKASRKLSEAAVTVRNQTVLLRDINDNVATMSSLIQKLAKMHIHPYYVYQCDMVPRVEHLRTPLQTILDLQKQLRGSIAGFDMPNFVVDLPGGGGKRLACDYESYDRDTGVSTFLAPVITKNGKEGKIYEYYDPIKPSS